MSQPENNQPEYGQYQQPEYGAMRSQYGPNYNPYIYGAPDTSSSQSANGANDGTGAPGTAGAQPQTGWQQPNGMPYGQGGQPWQSGQPSGQQNGQQGGQFGPGYWPGSYPGIQGQPYQGQFQQNSNANGQTGPRGQHRPPHFYNGINLDDPSQNPLYGHWDSYAIIAFVLALFFPVPVLSALMGGVAMWRTRTFHMKGFGLAVAAVIINILYTIAVIWMALNGVDASTLYQEALQQLMGGMGGSGSSGDSISA
ncbi:hypothetical protein [Bifidobacterium miconisargentati]|uniref:hypothetical protein n=1 Tax=Bifidobacterium miconisargentati TaxID=2834437 RepID=UPI001BDCDEF4|nr:hypothetical protein [Bifidobacterium miconisargentati]MBW3089333.1 hypothetical protein [Bifidobacterium miconisargentati]